MDDFSFPTIQTDQDSSHHFPVWFLSNEKTTYRRSFSSVQGATRVSDPLSDDEGARACARFVNDEDKMDLLWEDFNEEVRRVSCELKSDSKKARLAVKGSDTAADFCVLKGNNSLLPRKKPGLVVMIKVLKKMFFVQKIGSTKKGSVCKI